MDVLETASAGQLAQSVEEYLAQYPAAALLEDGRMIFDLRRARYSVGEYLLVDAAIAGVGVIYHFEDWLRPHLASGALEPILEDWWLSFSGPFLYYPGRRLVPAPLRAFVDFVKAWRDTA